MLLFLIFCNIVVVTFGVPLDEDRYIRSEEVVAYDDSEFFTLSPSPQKRAEQAGYTAETHEVVTADGYILQLHRITGSRSSPKAKNKPAVLLLHGLLDCSASWVLGSPQRSLGFLLADWGYDVWLGNQRGNRYARNHKWMTTKEKKYWLFSWHEIGVYDIPAMIDHVLEVTNQKKIIFVGHSQGTTSFLAMASLKPEYQAKVEAMFALAPPIYMGGMSHPMFKILAPLAGDVKAVADLIGLYEFMPSGKFIQQIARLVCDNEAITQPICKNIILLIAGSGNTLLNRTLIPEIVQYDPAGSSTRQFVHYAQLVTSKKFRQYDHGLLQNLKHYGSVSPPDYPIEQIKTRIYLHYSDNDGFVNVNDVYKLHKRLPNSQLFRVPELNFAHLDFIWGNSVDTLLYDILLSLMSRHRPKLNLNLSESL
ncbi:lipase 3-like [Calliopsis andreniformis]|uniref:lipase 3-like n=1 Tax=Calliopsis andreniformis TaxID=337506 RepID=UPI003FCDD6F8